MRRVTPLLVLFITIASTAMEAQMVISRSSSRPSVPGPADYFTGTVHVTTLFAATDSTRAAGASVQFEPCARSAWHTHPRGQVLIVTAGVGRVQEWGKAVEEIRPGDVVWTPPGVKHWHGASPTCGMTHLAIQEELDGKVVEWMEKVTDAEYLAEPSRADAGAGTPAVPTDARKAFGDVAPALAEYTDRVLFGDVWKRPGLSPRDRSLVTVSALVAGYRTNELPFHLKRALENGVRKDELIELITHLAFYSGWPTANTALPIARRVFDDVKP